MPVGLECATAECLQLFIGASQPHDIKYSVVALFKRLTLTASRPCTGFAVYSMPPTALWSIQGASGLSKMSTNRIVELANIISKNTEVVDSYLVSQTLPTPSFDAECPERLLFGHGEQIDGARQAVVDATDELQALMLGPTGLLSSLFVRMSQRTRNQD